MNRHPYSLLNVLAQARPAGYMQFFVDFSMIFLSLPTEILNCLAIFAWERRATICARCASAGKNQCDVILGEMVVSDQFLTVRFHCSKTASKQARTYQTLLHRPRNRNKFRKGVIKPWGREIPWLPATGAGLYPRVPALTGKSAYPQINIRKGDTARGLKTR